MDFVRTLEDPKRWIIKRSVPIFKAHERVDPNTKQLIKVDSTKLQRIAQNIQRMDKAGIPVRMTLGHTEPGKPETEQPPVCGYMRNARVQRFGPQQELAVVVDEWLDPSYLKHRKNYPFRSAEYYDDSEQITGVALLTRDPWLELGVVLYQKNPEYGCTYYSRASEGGQRHYHFLMGDDSMWPDQNPQNPPANGVVPPPQPQPTPTAAVPQPQGQTITAPTNYVGGVAWNANYHPPGMNRPHPQGRGQAVYANEPMQMSGGMSGGMPSGMSGGMSGGVPFGPSGGMSGGVSGPGGLSGGLSGGGDDVLMQVADMLSQAAAMLAQHCGAGTTGAAPQTPFPPSGGASGGMSGPSGPPIPASRAGYGRQPQRRYEGDRVPTQMTRTISGLPVGYQMELDKRDAQIRKLTSAMSVLYYERDQADTQSCISEIQSLAARGYNVGEYEVQELKAKNPEQRAAYIQHIMAKYEKIGTDYPPPILGDPTPGPSHNPQEGPASREEAMVAVEMAPQFGTGREAYFQALRYVREQGVNRISQYGSGFDQPPSGHFVDNGGGAWPEGGDAPSFPEPSSNGHG